MSKKGILFILLIASFGVCFALLLMISANTIYKWQFWVVLLVLPAIGWIAAKTDFNTGD